MYSHSRRERERELAVVTKERERGRSGCIATKERERENWLQLINTPNHTR